MTVGDRPGASTPDPPNFARIYDYLLGGARNFAVDRDAARSVLSLWPSFRVAARANRNFLRIAVERATDHGIAQFLDLGSGIPTIGSVHEIAGRRRPDARVAYVDNDPEVVGHSRTLLEGTDAVTVTEADLRDVPAVLGAPGVAGLLDFDRPVGLLALASLHFVTDDAVARRVLDGYRDVLSPGSILAVSHASDGYPVAARETMNRSSTPVTPRSPERLAALLGGWRVDADGIVDTRTYARERSPVEASLGACAFLTEPLAPPDAEA